VAVSAGYPEAGAAAVICFEWLQRPENVLAGYIRWTDYRSREAPKAIRIFHHKTGAIVLHPLPSTFTLDACRHGGMTELEEAELTDGQGRALSAHKSRAYEGYAKRTMERALTATRKRHAHLKTTAANNEGTEFRNEAQNPFRNDDKEQTET
jgi:hypothetical protein